MTITDYLRQIRENAWSSRQLGTEFERFVKRYFKTHPYYASQFDEVWLWSECPFAKGNDVGIDLVARTKFGEYVAIQAKCYQPGTQVDKADVDTFLSASGKQIAPDGKPTYYSQRIIIATNDNWTSHASQAMGGFRNALVNEFPTFMCSIFAATSVLKARYHVVRAVRYSVRVPGRLSQSRYWSRAGRRPNKMRKSILAKSVRVFPAISFLLRVDKFPQKAKEAI